MSNAFNHLHGKISWPVFFALSIIYSCNRSKPMHDQGLIPLSKKDVITYNPGVFSQDTNIINTTKRTVRFLYNSARHAFPITDSTIRSFRSEFMMNMPVEVLAGSILYGKQLKLSTNGATHHTVPFAFNGDVLITIDAEEVPSVARFLFSKGSGNWGKTTVSCNDSKEQDVTLKYPDGIIQIKRLLNPCFFEHDMDNNGQYEQYLIGVRHCSSELTIISIH